MTPDQTALACRIVEDRLFELRERRTEALRCAETVDPEGYRAEAGRLTGEIEKAEELRQELAWAGRVTATEVLSHFPRQPREDIFS